MTPIEAILFLGGTAVLAMLVWVMHARHQSKSYPFFFAYIFFSAITSATEFATLKIYGLYSIQYFDLYWMDSAVGVVLAFLALYEVLRHVTRSETRSLPVRAVVIAFIALLTGAFLLTRFLEPRSLSSMNIPRLILFSDGVIHFAQLGVLLSYLVLTIFFGFYWEGQAFGIAAGYGFRAIVMIAAWEVGRRYGFNSNLWSYVKDVPSAATAICFLIWLRYSLLSPAPSSAPISLAHQEAPFIRPLQSLFR